MRAVVAHAAKDLRIEEVPSPDVGPHEVRVRVGFGGICGSDLHYFNHGGFGAVRLREPMILGHEVAATVEEVGAAVTRAKPGDRAAVNPSLPATPANTALWVARTSASTCASTGAPCVCRTFMALSGSPWSARKNKSTRSAIEPRSKWPRSRSRRRLRPRGATGRRSRRAARAGDRLRPDRRARHARGEARRGARDCRHRPHRRDPGIRTKDRSRPHRQHVFQSRRAGLLHGRQGLFRRRFRGDRRHVRLRNCIERGDPEGSSCSWGSAAATCPFRCRW